MTRTFLAPGVVCLLSGFAPFVQAQAAADSSGNIVDPQTCQTAADGPSRCWMSQVNRKVLVGDVVEYSLILRVGSAPHDLIGVHRVVRETAPFVAQGGKRAVMMLHGSRWGFNPTFTGGVATSNTVLPTNTMAVNFALQGLDVWGVDQRWVFIPPETTEFSFMHPWNLQTEIGDVRTALEFARFVRRFTVAEQNPNLALLGWSEGAGLAYAYADYETQLDSVYRYVDALIPVDYLAKYGEEGETYRQSVCETAAMQQQEYDSGTSAISNIPDIQLAFLAKHEPNQPSTTYPGLTNLQAVWYEAGATYKTGTNMAPYYHFLGASFDESGTPTGLLYTTSVYYLNLSYELAVYEPLAVSLDENQIICDEMETRYDNHLGEIQIPVFYLGAAGGIGTYGVYTTTLLGSSDVTTYIVQKLSDDQRLNDFGHTDLFFAQTAPQDAWLPITAWLGMH